MKKTCKVLMMVFAVAFGVLLLTGTSSKAAATITGLQQTKASSTSVTVQWQAVMENSVYYSTHIGTSANNLTRQDNQYGTTGYISGLTEGGTYYVQVRAYSDYARNTVIAISPVIQVATTLADVSGVTQTSATGNTITMKWNPVTGATSYYIYRYANSTYTQIGSSKTASYMVTGLSPSLQASFYVVAVKTTTSGFTVSSDYYRGASMRTTPAKPANVAITSWYDNINVAYLGWNGVSCNGYQVQIQNSKGKTLLNQDVSYNSLRVSPFWKGVFTKTRVRGYITIGNKKLYGPWSDYSYNASNKSIKISSKSRKIKVKWKKITGAAGYTIYISNKSDSGFKKVKTLGKKKTSITIKKCGKKKLKKRKTYYVRVKYLTKVGKKKVASGVMGQGSIYVY
ncbi:MAG: fibronectin type III domain-containing protein [Lachnospiraceae bacterium]|nr:fibronectin type III domain-containing protein [Lachnospiraceae bacterium]